MEREKRGQDHSSYGEIGSPALSDIFSPSKAATPEPKEDLLSYDIQVSPIPLARGRVFIFLKVAET